MAAHPLPHHGATEPLVFELLLDRERTLLELDAREDRAFVVGASPHADVRVRRPRVPPVAFYLERRANHAWLVPGYRRGNLRVNGALAIAPCRLGRRTRIEFAGVRAELEAVTRSGASLKALVDDDDPPTEISANTRRSRLAYFESLPDVEDRTHAELEPVTFRPPPGGELVRCPPSAVLRKREPLPEPPAEHRHLHLGTLLAERPFEAVALVLVVAAVMAGAAIAAALILRFASPA